MRDSRTLLALVAVLLAAAADAWGQPLAVLTGPGAWEAWKAEGDWTWVDDWVGGTGTNRWRWAEIGSARSGTSRLAPAACRAARPGCGLLLR